jgi:hypothetical protein
MNACNDCERLEHELRRASEQYVSLIVQHDQLIRDDNLDVKGKPKEALGKVMNDPTLEGKDENKVGRVQRKTGGNGLEK